MTDLKKTKVRSAAYPAVSLPEAIDLMKKIKDSLGKAEYSRPHMLKALGYTADGGEAARKVAALVQFGLVNRANSVYQYNNLSDRILCPTSDEMQAIALIEAVNTPTLYGKLLVKYGGQPLPGLLGNILAVEFKISEKVSKIVIEDFVKSIEFAGIYNNNIVAAKVDIQDYDESVGEVEEAGVKQSADNLSKNKPEILDTPSDFKTLELPCGAVLKYPAELAYDFAVGEFSEVIKSLNTRLAKALADKNNVDLPTGQLE